jgi:hypothetical protein
MFDNLMQNLFANTKNQLELQKKEFEDKYIDFISTEQNIKIKINANGKIVDISLSDDFLKFDKEQIEDLLVVNLNKAIEKAEKFRNEEIEKMKNSLIPNIDDILDSFNEIE